MTVAEARAALIKAIDDRTAAEKLGFKKDLCQLAAYAVGVAIEKFEQAVRHDETNKMLAQRAEADNLTTSDPKAGGHA